MTDLELTADQRAALEAVALIGDHTVTASSSERRGATARAVAAECGWRSTNRHGQRVASRRSAVNRLLVLRRLGYVADVEGRWFTTDAGHRLLFAEGE